MKKQSKKENKPKASKAEEVDFHEEFVSLNDAREAIIRNACCAMEFLDGVAVCGNYKESKIK